MGIQGILNPSMGHCPLACPAGGGGRRCFPWRWPGGPRWPWSSPAAREIGSVFLKIRLVLAVFIEAPAASCQEPVNDERFFNDGAFNHNDQFVLLSIFKAGFFFQEKRLKPSFYETRSPRPSFACVLLSTPSGGAHYHGLFRPTKTSSANTPQPISHVHSCSLLLLLLFLISRVSANNLG